MNVSQLLATLLQSTPLPEGKEPSDLLEQAEKITQARKSLLTQIVAATGGKPWQLDADDRKVLAEIEKRQRHWDGVLRAARGKTGMRLDAMRRQQREAPRGGALGYQVA